MPHNPLPPDDDSILDPWDAELVAYLDGELDPQAAQRVEQRLANDPAARARAAELKKAYDLLDYLPRTEPSANFTSRTLDKLPTLRRPTVSKISATPAPAAAELSTSVPLSLNSQTFKAKPPSAAKATASIVMALAILLAVVVCIPVGYGLAALSRGILADLRDNDSATRSHEPNPRVIEWLPLYAVIDDIQFLEELASSEYFGEDPSVAFDPTLRIPSHETITVPTGKEFDQLAKSFRSLPLERQKAIIQLDAELHQRDAKERDRLLRVLEAYAAWLDRLPESERRGILAAATPGLRLGVVRDVRERHWLDSLPAAVRTNPELVKQWREEEAIRRDRWAFIRQHAEEFAANKSPWPFDTEAGKKEVLDYAKNVFKVDDPPRCRLNAVELEEYRSRLDVARRENLWAWFGLLVFELANQKPYLPEPENPKLLYTDFKDLPQSITFPLLAKKGLSTRLRAASGKWPEYPLEVHRELSGLSKFGNIPPLGPARLADFKPAVREFAREQLFPKMSADEKRDLARWEGKWPEYPQRLLYYAHKYDLPVPGVTLPGSPKRWESTYGIRFRPQHKK
ncbi:MAG: hypothetical protein RMJ56_08065 [Gemmataceae bacterium]|nr:hypothetical protein [Gemmata sp.]MDW8197545.1 hypothetical protein [Gemmataceae bacterium]